MQRLATASTTLISLDAANRVSVLPADVRRALVGRRRCECIVARRDLRAPRRARIAALAALVALPLLGACASGAGTRAVSTPRSSRDVDVARYGRLLAMADERRVDTALIQTILRSGSSAERAAAALAIGQVHGTRARAHAARAARRRDTAVAANAAYALGLLADTAQRRRTRARASAPRRRAPQRRVGARTDRRAGARGDRRGLRRSPALSPQGTTSRRTARVPASVRGALLLATFKLKPVPVEAVRPWLADREPARALERRLRDRAPVLRRRRARARSRSRPTPSAEVRAQVARAFSHRAAGDSLADARARTARRARDRPEPARAHQRTPLARARTAPRARRSSLPPRTIPMRTCASPPRRSSARCSTTRAPRG